MTPIIVVMCVGPAVLPNNSQSGPGSNDRKKTQGETNWHKNWIEITKVQGLQLSGTTFGRNPRSESDEDDQDSLSLSSSSLRPFLCIEPRKNTLGCTPLNIKHRPDTDLDVTDLGFWVLCDRCSVGTRQGFFTRSLFKQLRTEPCHEVRNPGLPKPHIICNENHHLALCLCIDS